MARPGSLAYSMSRGAPYSPDPNFVKRLKGVDSKLEVRWMPRLQRWGIFRESRHFSDRCFIDGVWLRVMEDVPVQIFTCETPTKGFRQPGGWDLKHLREIDLWRLHRAADDLIRRIDTANEKRRLDSEAQMDDLNKEGVNTLWDRIHEKKTVDMGANL